MAVRVWHRGLTEKKKRPEFEGDRIAGRWPRDDPGTVFEEAVLSRFDRILDRVGSKARGFLEMLSFDNGKVLVLDRILHPSAKMSIYRKGELEIPVYRPGGDLQSIRTCLVGPMSADLAFFWSTSACESKS